jgi:hypothetical protein
MEIACVLIPEAVCAPEGGSSGTGAQGSLEAGELTEWVVRRLEGIGAAVESERPGEAYFAVDGLQGIHGGDTAGVLAAARGAAGTPLRVAAAPTRFAAWVAASGSPGPLSALPVAMLAGRLGLRDRAAADLVDAMGRLGIGTLGALAALSPARVADRFGPAGLRAHRLARGEEEPLRPRAPHEELAEEIELPEGTAATSSTGPWSFSSTASSRRHSDAAGPCWGCVSARGSAAAAAGASSRGWAGRPPLRGCCARF